MAMSDHQDLRLKLLDMGKGRPPPDRRKPRERWAARGWKRPNRKAAKWGTTAGLAKEDTP